MLGSYLLTLLAGLLCLLVVMLFEPIRQAGLSPLLSGLALGVWFGAGVLALPLHLLARRMCVLSASKVMKKDRRPPILLLRAFNDDQAAVGNAPDALDWRSLGLACQISFEQLLCDLFAGCGPTIAIGRPGESIPPLGAARFWVSNDSWQQAVEELLAECQRVVMIMGRIQGRDGLAWEAEKLLNLKTPEKVVLVMPPIDEEAEVKARWETYRQLSGNRLPPYEGGEVAATFDASGKCVVARTEGMEDFFFREEQAYRTALQVPRRFRPGRLLVLAVILGFFSTIGISVALPAAQQVREAAARIQCINNLKQITLSLRDCQDANQSLPPMTGPCTGPQSNGNLFYWLLPYIEQSNQDVPLGAGRGTDPGPIVQQSIKTSLCPSNQPVQIGTNSWAGGNSVANPATGDTSIKARLSALSAITDGTSNTLIVADRYEGGKGLEQTRWPDTWSTSASPNFRPPPLLLEGRWMQAPDSAAFEQFFPAGGINVCIGDGSDRSQGSAPRHGWNIAAPPDRDQLLNNDW